MFEDRSSVSERLRALREMYCALNELRVNANRLCDRNQGGTYEEDCRRSLARADAAIAEVGELDALLSAEVPHAAFHDVPRDQDGPIRIAMEMRSAAHHDRTKDACTRSALAGWADRLSEWFSRSAEVHASTGEKLSVHLEILRRDIQQAEHEIRTVALVEWGWPSGPRRDALVRWASVLREASSALAPCTTEDETPCPIRGDGQHCNCWYDGKVCCACEADAALPSPPTPAAPHEWEDADGVEATVQEQVVSDHMASLRELARSVDGYMNRVTMHGAAEALLWWRRLLAEIESSPVSTPPEHKGKQ
jgi:hypothetical protein